MKTEYDYGEKIHLHCQRCHGGVNQPRGRRWVDTGDVRRLWQYYRCSVCGSQIAKVMDVDAKKHVAPTGPAAAVGASARPELKSRAKEALTGGSDPESEPSSVVKSRFEDLLDALEE